MGLLTRLATPSLLFYTVRTHEVREGGKREREREREHPYITRVIIKSRLIVSACFLGVRWPALLFFSRSRSLDKPENKSAVERETTDTLWFCFTNPVFMRRSFFVTLPKVCNVTIGCNLFIIDENKKKKFIHHKTIESKWLEPINLKYRLKL